MEGVKIVDGVVFYECEFWKVVLEMISYGWLVFLDGFDVFLVFGIGKCFFDILVVIMLFIFGLLLMFFIVIVIKIEDGLKVLVLYS